MLVDHDDDDDDDEGVDDRSWGSGALMGRGAGVGTGLDQPRTRVMKGDKGWDEIGHHKGGGSGSVGSGDRATSKIGIEPPSSSSTGSGAGKTTGSSNNNGGSSGGLSNVNSSSSNTNSVNNNSNSDGKTSMVGSLWSQLVRIVDRYLFLAISCHETLSSTISSTPPLSTCLPSLYPHPPS